MHDLYIIIVSSLLANSHGNQMTPICHNILTYWTPYISLANQFKIYGYKHPPYFPFSNCTFAFTLPIFFCRDYICLLSLIDHLSSSPCLNPPCDASNPIHPPNCHLSIAPICNPYIVNWKKFYSTTQMATTWIHPVHLWHKKYLVHLVIVNSPSEIYPNTYVHVNHWT